MEISPITHLLAEAKPESIGNSTSQSQVNFESLLKQELSSVNTQINNAESQLQKLALGEADNLHHVMVELEKAKLSFELMVQIRNKALEGVQEIMKMSI